MRNHAQEIAKPADAKPQVPAGFSVTKLASELSAPRMLRTAPNGDVFVAESRSDRVRLMRDANGQGTAEPRARIGIR